MNGLGSGTADRLQGEVRVPGDKSISHRALMIGALAVGETRVTGLSSGEDVMRTAAVLRALGATIERDGKSEDGAWRIRGVGVGGLAEPDEVLDFGNSGTGARLLMGMLATHPFTSHLTGDASLCSRPMGRVAEPIERMGARVMARSGGRMPLAVIGAADPLPITYQPPVASAQVKSAVLLAGLNAPGRTTVIEPKPTRDHTELMLRQFGAEIDIAESGDGTRTIALTGQPELEACAVAVPGDPSSAAFPGVAALLVPGSEVTVKGVCMNPLRAGLFATLREMGADIRISGNPGADGGDAMADLTFHGGEPGSMKAIDVPAARAPSMIDEYPVLAVAAAFASGTTRMHGLAELRVKESDRLAAIADGLAACGVRAGIDGDTLAVEGLAGAVPGGGRIEARMDHRIAMAFLVLGLAAPQPVEIDDADAIATSFPGFTALMNGLGARIGR